MNPSSAWKPSLPLALDILRMDNIIKYLRISVQILGLETTVRFCKNSNWGHTGKHVCFHEIVDLSFQQLAGTILNTRMEIVKYFVDHGLPLFHNVNTDCCEDKQLLRYNLRSFVFPMDNGRTSLIYLFKAGAHFKVLSSACVTLKSKYYYPEDDDRELNFFKALVLNGLEVDERDLQELLKNSMLPNVCQRETDLCLKMSTWYREQRQKPFLLSQLCRIKIRKELLRANKFVSILPLIDNLVLPEDLKLYLKFEGMYNEIDL